MKLTQISSLYLAITLVSSCSLLQRRSGEDAGSKDGQELENSNYVSRAQYEKLLKKYQSLKAEQTGGDGEITAANVDVSEPSAETVSLFDDGKSAPAPRSMAPRSSKITIEDDEINDSLSQLYKAIQSYQARDYSAALNVLDRLNRSSVDQVRVRSRYYTGLILFEKQEHDLALQVFEEVLQNHSFSYLVLDSLKYAYNCAQKLNLDDKANRYQSMLRDIFKVI
jgi:tetratricopeptide (TPR) repeat protein